jgi:hypothetical protein
MSFILAQIECLLGALHMLIQYRVIFLNFEKKASNTECNGEYTQVVPEILESLRWD